MATTKKIRKLKKYVLSENQTVRRLIKEVSAESYIWYANECYERGDAWGRRVASKMMKRYRRANQK